MTTSTAKAVTYTEAPLRPLTDEEIAVYQRDGAAVVRGIIPNDWIERMRDALEVVLNDPGAAGFDFNASKEKGRFFGDLMTWLYNDDFKALVFDSPLAEIAGRAMGSPTVNFFYDQVLVKEPGTVERTPWHQDLPYWPVRGEHVISIWMPLDIVTSNSGSVIYVAGSHKWDKWFEPAEFNFNPDNVLPVDMQREKMLSGDYDDMPDIDGNPEKFEFLCWDMEPGDCILHHPRTVHGAAGNSTAHMRRRAISMRWTGEECHFDDSEGNFLEPLFEMDMISKPGLKIGDPMGGDLFPRVWPRNTT